MRYFGTYERFEVADDEDIGRVLSADNSVGDVYDIELSLEDGLYTGSLINAYGQRIGYFDHGFSKRLAVMSAEGIVEKALLSYIAYTADGDSGRYWGEMAVICYDPAFSEQFERFMGKVSARIADDVRPKLDLDREAVDRIIDANGDWLPSQSTILPDAGKDKAYIKRRKRFNERLADQGRAGNKGCYAASWALMAMLLVAIAFGVKACMGL